MIITLFAAFFLVGAMALAEISRRNILLCASDQMYFRRREIVGRAQRALAASVLCGAVALGFVVIQIETPLLPKRTDTMQVMVPAPEAKPTVGVADSQPAIAVSQSSAHADSASPPGLQAAEASHTVVPATADGKVQTSRVEALFQLETTVSLHMPGSRRVRLRDAPDGSLLAELPDLTRAQSLAERAVDSRGQQWTRVKTFSGLQGWVRSSALPQSTHNMNANAAGLQQVANIERHVR